MFWREVTKAKVRGSHALVSILRQQLEQARRRGDLASMDANRQLIADELAYQNELWARLGRVERVEGGATR